MDKAKDDNLVPFEANKVISLLNQGYSVADLCGVSTEQLEGLYALAYQYYQAADYEDALKIFRGLCLYDSKQVKYHMGQGGCLQNLGRYQEAVDAYSIGAVMSGLKDPEPMYYACICLLKQNRKQDAITGLESIAVMGREGNQKDAEFVQKAKDLMAILKE